MEIVSARPQDCDRLSAIAQAAKAHWKYPPAWLEAWRDELTFTAEMLEAQDVFAARSDGELRGVCALAFDGREGSIEHLWVDPAAMGQGIGRHLIEDALKRAKDAGVEHLEILSDPNAAGFYERFGAVHTRDHHGEVLGEPRVLPIYVLTVNR